MAHPKSTLYTLWLRDEKWFVGILVGDAESLHRTVNAHELNNGGQWTSHHSLISLVYATEIEPGEERVAEFRELARLMRRYGVDSTRSTSYDVLVFTPEQRVQINALLETSAAQEPSLETLAPYTTTFTRRETPMTTREALESRVRELKTRKMALDVEQAAIRERLRALEAREAAIMNELLEDEKRLFEAAEALHALKEGEGRDQAVSGQAVSGQAVSGQADTERVGKSGAGSLPQYTSALSTAADSQ